MITGRRPVVLSRNINSSEDQISEEPLDHPAVPSGECRYHEFGPYLLDSHLCILYREGTPVPLAHKTFEILLILVRNRDRVVPREELLRAIWPDVNVEASNITQNIYVLRKTLERQKGERYIQTIPGRGYRFLADSTESSLPRPSLSSVETVLQEQEIISSPAADVEPLSLRKPFPKIWLAFLALFCLIGIGTVAVLFRFSSAGSVLPLVRFATSLPGSATEPALSPDATRVAFVWNGEDQSNYDIYVKPISSETSTRLTVHAAVDTSPAWSPDGQSIAYLRLAPGDGGLYIVPARGGSEKKLTGVYSDRLGIKARHLDWSPDGKFLVVDDKGGPQESVSLFLISAATGERKRLTSVPARSPSDLAPRFSPNGAFVAFIRSSSATVRDIYVVPTSGGTPARLTFDERWIGDLDWTPDGREILFSSDRADEPGLWKVAAPPARAGAPRRVSPTGDRAGYLTVARHGSRLAYSQSSESENFWKLDLGTQVWTKLNTPVHNVAAPDYSPDGSQILFRSDAPGKRTLGIARADGSNPRVLPLSVRVHSASWSPDGSMLTVDIHQQGHYHIYTLPARGGQPRPLTFADFDDEYPRWAPDGKSIYFSSNRTGYWQIWRVAAAGGGTPEQVTQEGGYAGRFSPDGKTLFYSKHQSLPGVWSVPVAGGAELLTMPGMRPERWGLWTVSPGGIYFVDDDGALGLNHPAQVKFYSFSDHVITSIVPLPNPIALAGFLTLTLSPDRRSLLLPLVDRSASDIVLVDRYR
jgi:Tol biopolymer transport system component/DNA-binding winged helix-turn-helix (wHTH) protein